MLYIVIGLGILSAILTVQLFSIYRSLTRTIKQMDAIEKHPEGNRQLKAFSINRRIEKILQKINAIYQARQQERIVYQKREMQIRKEIENISHDLRTPLTTIIGYVDLMKDKDISEAEKEEYLSLIYKRARVLQSFIQDFYEISRMEGEDYPLLLEVVPVQKMLREAVAAYYHEFEQKDIEVKVELLDKRSSIIVDIIQFNRILNNLIQNAIKYAGRQFALRQFTKDGRCILQFINDRNNMKEDDLKFIFDRFYTGEQSRTNGSTGLGLTITKLLVEKMKGYINASFEGEMFVIELQWGSLDSQDL